MIYAYKYIYETFKCLILLQGFDEFMNLVLDESEEHNIKTGEKA